MHFSLSIAAAINRYSNIQLKYHSFIHRKHDSVIEPTKIIAEDYKFLLKVFAEISKSKNRMSVEICI